MSGGTAGPGDSHAPERAPEEPPPFLGSWRRIYLLVALELGLVIALLIWLSAAFR